MVQSASSSGARVLFGACALVIAVVLAGMAPAELTWKAGRELTRQPGFFSILSIGGMLAFGLVWLVFTWREAASERMNGALEELFNWCRAAEYAGWFLLYVFLAPWIGYLVGTIVFSVALTFRLGYRSKKMLTAAALFAFFTVVIFKSFLAVKIPGGVVYEYLPDSIRNFMILYL